MSKFKEETDKNNPSIADRTSSKITDALKEFSDTISEYSAGAVTLKMIPGCFTNLGQEWLMRLYREDEPDPLMTLFRVHVPANGTTYLDLGDIDMIPCEDETDVRKHLAKFWKELLEEILDNPCEFFECDRFGEKSIDVQYESSRTSYDTAEEHHAYWGDIRKDNIGDVNEFLEVMKAVKVKPPENAEALKVLDEFCEAVKKFTGNKVKLSRERGYSTNLGQEWRFCLKEAGDNSETLMVLFSVHVPRQGVVYLDLGGEDMEGCDTPEDIKGALKRFIQEGFVVEEIMLLSEDQSFTSPRPNPTPVNTNIAVAAHERRLEEWIEDVRELVVDVQRWAEEEGWRVVAHDKTITIEERAYGLYKLPVLFIWAPQDQKLVVDPVGLDIVGANGRIDIEDFPSLNRFILIRKNRKWEVMTDSMTTWPEIWGKEAFFSIASELAKHRRERTGKAS